jgi:hypothetical protein
MSLPAERISSRISATALHRRKWANAGGGRRHLCTPRTAPCDLASVRRVSFGRATTALLVGLPGLPDSCDVRRG